MRYPDAQQLKIDAGNSRVFLPKLGWIRYRNSRELLGTAKTITVASNGGKWFVSIQTEREVAESVPLSASIIGVGVGVGITRIANVRRDFRHKTSTTISQNHAMVCIEDLRVRNLSKSAAGSSQAPGRKVEAQVGPQRVDSGSRLVRVSQATAMQAGPARRRGVGGLAAQYQPDVPWLRPGVGTESPDPWPVRLCAMGR